MIHCVAATGNFTGQITQADRSDETGDCSCAVSVIIPTYNRSKLVIATVEQVLRQDLANLDLLVVDQSDPEHQMITAKALRGPIEAGMVRYVPTSRIGVANARNEGLARAIGRIIVFLDDDVILLNPSFLRAHLACYDDPSVGGVCGRTIERVIQSNTRRTANRITFGGRTVVNLLGQERCRIHSLKGANMSIRAAAIAGIGGFDRNYTGTALLEEADFSERIIRRGWRLIFEPQAELIHLSAPAGGVRVGRAEDTEFFRFRSTAYFVRKHRGLPSLLAFAATHIAVASLKTIQLRKPGLPLRLLRGALSGSSLARQGPDHALPRLSRQSATKADAHAPGLAGQFGSRATTYMSASAGSDA